LNESNKEKTTPCAAPPTIQFERQNELIGFSLPYRGLPALGRRLSSLFFSIDCFISLISLIPLLNQFKEEKEDCTPFPWATAPLKR